MSLVRVWGQSYDCVIDPETPRSFESSTPGGAWQDTHDPAHPSSRKPMMHPKPSSPMMDPNPLTDCVQSGDQHRWPWRVKHEPAHPVGIL